MNIVPKIEEAQAVPLPDLPQVSVEEDVPARLGGGAPLTLLSGSGQNAHGVFLLKVIIKVPRVAPQFDTDSGVWWISR